MMAAPRKLQRGDFLYRHGDCADSVFVIKAGVFMTGVPADNGSRQVTGFQMAGDLLGLDGIGTDVYAWDVVALQDSVVCPIRVTSLSTLSSALPTLQRHFHRAMSREMLLNQRGLLLLGKTTAEERVVAFLLHLSQRFSACGYPSSEFRLLMNRGDIASFLGLKLETVSRIFSHLAAAGLIAVQQKNIRLLEMSQLQLRARCLSPI
jgi:CRP/FNR family transcriptional regulator